MARPLMLSLGLASAMAHSQLPIGPTPRLVMLVDDTIEPGAKPAPTKCKEERRSLLPVDDTYIIAALSECMMPKIDYAELREAGRRGPKPREPLYRGLKKYHRKY